MPKRLQRQRTRGWKLPEGAVCVCRPGRWGNPFIVNPHVRPGSRSGSSLICLPNAQEAVECYRVMLVEIRRDLVAEARVELAGRDLACWCKLCRTHAGGRPMGIACAECAPCHADVLLTLANQQREVR